MSALLLVTSFFAMILLACIGGGYLLFYREHPVSLRYTGKLAAAGYRTPAASLNFLNWKLGLAAGCGLLLGLFRILASGDWGASLGAVAAGAGLGYLLPDRILAFLARRRSQRILEGIPTAIDLLVLSLESGQSIDSALGDTVRELAPGFPDLSAELRAVQLEMLASRGRGDVFKALRDRTPEPELKRLCQVFIDGDRFGTSMGPTLRTHVKYLRLRLRQQAQEQARKVGVKLIFPVFFLIFPAIIVVTLGPAILQVREQMRTLMAPH